MLNSENFSESLPKNWVLVKLDNICEILDRQRIPVNVRDRDDRIAGKDKIQLFPYYGATGQVGWIDDYLFEGEHILLGEDGAPFLDAFKDKAYIVNGRFWVNNHAHILKSYGSNKLLCHYLNQLDYGYFVTGTTRLKLNQASMKQIPIKVPPLPEQQQIVTKIEELFSELDNGIEKLKKAREQLKIYRQAVLKYAFQGKLAKQWRTLERRAGNAPEPAKKLLEQIKTEREKHYEKQVEDWEKVCELAKTEGKNKPAKPKKPKELSALTEKELEELPERWKWEQIKEIITVLGDGLHGTPIYSDEGDYYFINGNNLSDGKIEIKENTKRVTIEEYEKYEKPLSENTVLVSINGTLGNTAFYNGEKVILGKSACYFNVLNTIDKHYIRYSIISQRFINYAHKNATGSTIKNVSLKAMREFKIPIPPTLEEQQAIVSEIETRLSVCDKLEQTIEDSLKKAEALRQSILKKAFSGELTKEWRLPAGRHEKNGEVYIVENSSGKLMPKRKESHFVYVLECEDGSIYKGITSTLNKIINDHLAGIGAEWTKTHRPIALIHYEEFKSEKEAVEREKYLKSGIGREWLKELQKEKAEQYLSAEKLLEKIKAEKALFTASRKKPRSKQTKKK